MVKYLKASTTAESSYGNALVDLTKTLLRAKSISYPVDRGLLIEENIESYIPVAAYGGALKVSGSIEGNLRPKQMSILFQALFGVSAALGGSDPITSGTKFTLGEPQSIQLEVGEKTAATGSEIALDYYGVGIKTMNLTINAKEFVVAKFDWFAKIYKTGTFSAPTAGDYSVEDPIVFYNAEVSFDGGSTVTNIKNMTINIDRKVDEERYVIGDYTLQEIGVNGMTSVTGDITFTEKEYAQFKAALYGAATGSSLGTGDAIAKPTFQIMFTSIGDTEVDKMFIKFGAINFGSTDTTMNGQNEIEKKISWTGTGDATSFEIGIAT